MTAKRIEEYNYQRKVIPAGGRPQQEKRCRMGLFDKFKSKEAKAKEAAEAKLAEEKKAAEAAAEKAAIEAKNVARKV